MEVHQNKPYQWYDLGLFPKKQTIDRVGCITIKPNECYDHVWLSMKQTTVHDGRLSLKPVVW